MAARSWRDVLQNAVNEANQKIVDGQQPEARLRAADPLPREQGRDRGRDGGQGRPLLHRRARGPAEDSSSPTCRTSRWSNARSPRSPMPKSTPRWSAWLPAEPLLPAEGRQGQGREGRPPRSSPSSARIEGEKFDGGTGEGIRLDARRRPASSPASRSSSSGVKAGEEPHRQGDLPGELHRDPSRRQGRPSSRLPSRRSQAPTAVKIDDELAKAFGMESLDALKDAVREQLGSRLRRPVAPQGQEEPARCPRRQVQLRAAADAGRAGVLRRLEPGRGRHEAGQQDLRRRGHHRGRRPAPTIARSPSAACASAWCWREIGEKTKIQICG